MSTDTYNYDEIDLFELLEVLVKKWRVLVGMVLVAALCVAIFTLLKPPTYKSGFTVLVDEEMPLEAFKKILISQAYVVVDKLPQTEEKLTVKRLSESSIFSVDEEARLISFSVSDNDPEQVYTIANLWLKSFENQCKKLVAEEQIGLKSVAQTDLAVAQSLYDQLVAERNEIEIVRSLINKELVNAENQIIAHNNRLEDINIKLKTETERSDIINQQIQDVKPIIRLRMPIIGFQGTLQIEEQEQLNSIYQELLRQKIALSASMAALTAEKQENLVILEKAQEQYVTLKNQLISLNNRFSELESLITTERRQADYWNNELHHAANKLAKLDAKSLTVIQNVVKPEDREARGLMLNTAVAAFLALFVGIFGVLLEHAWANRRQTGAISS